MNQLHYGGVPVPYTVSWSAEETFHVAPCPHAGNRPSICQAVARGEGRPRFGKPHSQRQREVIVHGLCDLCGKPLKNRTKVSLSHARVRPNGAEGPAIMQVEPLLHKECAATSMEHCPSLKRDIADGSLMVRQVNLLSAGFSVAMREALRPQQAPAAPVRDDRGRYTIRDLRRRA